MKLLTTILLLAIVQPVLSQGRPDSVRTSIKGSIAKPVNKIDSLNLGVTGRFDTLSLPGDSTTRASIQKAEAIRSSFQKSADSIQLAYRKPVNKLDSSGRSLQHKIDSLNKLRLPTIKLSPKLDSINRLRAEKMTEMNAGINKIKAKANDGLKQVQLPPEMQGPVQKLSQSINGYSIPMVNGKIPGLDISSLKIPGLQLPSTGLNAPSLPNANIPGAPNTGANPLSSITNQTNEISKVTGQVGAYGKDVKNITQGNLDEVKTLDKTAESEAVKASGASELQGKTKELDALKSKMNGSPDSLAMGMVKQEIMKEATNHFAGKEEVLQGAMDKMSKLKSRYTEVKSMAELPKKLPNPLHDLPFIERIIPGVTFQILSKGHVLLDVNPNAVYRITPRLSAGAGWVERIAFEGMSSQERVYGPRGIFQFNWKNGFALRFQPELLNTFVPPYLVNPGGDTGDREWVWSAIVGIKKEFKVYKNIKGTTEALYNLYNPQSKSPYQDRLMVRFGFEFPMKKKK